MKKIRRIPNVRDLGGIVTENGQKVVSGKLLRGGYLCKIKDKDKVKFKEEWKVTSIVDLRSKSEVSERPDIVPEGIEYYFLPTLSDEQNPAITNENRIGILRKISKRPDGAIGHLSDNYRAIITQDMARENHRKMVELLLRGQEGAVYFHCTQGKDRTGVASAIILMALGASEEAILEDYLNERLWLRVKNRILCFLTGIILRSAKAGSNLLTLMNARKPCLMAALDEMKSTYQTAENYLREGIGITDDEIMRLRKLYLE